MKRLIHIISILLAAAFAVLSIGCANKENASAPKEANDPEIISEWDSYPMLNDVPRYAYSGIFDNFYVNEDRTVVSYLGVSQEDYEAYVQLILASGYRLKENSAIWVAEGISGVPEFERGNAELILVWSFNGSLDISAEAVN